MERAVAVKKLSKLLGKKFGWQINSKAPTAEERAAAKDENQEAVKTRQEIGDKLKNRREQILAADSEYQALLAGYNLAQERCNKLTSVMHHYKFCVGTSNKLFFHVAAQGDSWEEVIAEVERKQKAGQLIEA